MENVIFTELKRRGYNVDVGVVEIREGDSRKKVEIYSLPYRSIDMWSIENAGTLDLNAEVELWTKAGHIKINLKRGVDTMDLDKLFANSIL